MKVLLVSYHYPPMGGAGVQRALKFSKYLGDFGVQATVLAAHDPGYLQDASLLAEVPADVPVLRIEHRPLLQRVLAWRSHRGAARVASAQPALPRLPSAGPPTRRLRDAALAAYGSLRFPDDKAAWARRAVAPAAALLREQRFDLVFSTAPPMSAHALAARLARQAGLPWVADYRDLWTENPGYAAPGWRRALDRRTEATWLAQAAGVVTVTPSWQRLLAGRTGLRRPVAFIPNGYDEADFTALEPVPREPGVVRIVHAGTFYGHQTPQPLLAAVGALLAQRPAERARLRVRFVGMVGARFAPLLEDFANSFPGVLECTGFVDHGRAIAEMMAANLLVLVVGGGDAARGVLPGKVFEYMRTRRPVLLIGPDDGDAAQLLRAHSPCTVAGQMDIERISAAIAAALEEQAVPAAAACVAAFERRALAGELARFLRQCREGWSPP